MGTRHLIAIVANEDYKVAQYGQWDGYPSGQGIDVLNCLRVLDLTAFKERILTCRWLTQEEIDNEKKFGDALFLQRNPQLSRDVGAKIISMIAAKPNLGLVNSIDFAGDSLFCEWAYVIDLDKMTLEVFKGFNTSPLPSEERFANIPHCNNGYYGIKHKRTFSLTNLPNNEEFEHLEKEIE